MPGITRTLGGFQVSDHPIMYVIDTPGILIPKIQDETTAMKLALTHAIPESLAQDHAQASARHGQRAMQKF